MTDLTLGAITDSMPKSSIKIFLPAAGLGERLRPISYLMPKPLLPIMGKPLIEIILEKFSAISSGKIGINLHYKSEMMREWVMRSAFAERIELFPENPILGTGGALKNAEPFLSDGHFLVHNADILSDIDFARLIETHLAESQRLSSTNIATLATHDYPKYNNVVVDENGYLVDVENPGTSMPNPDTIAKKVAYTGIAVYSPEILKFLPAGVSHATVAWVAAAAAGYKVQTLDFTGCYWNDIGTPASYASAIINALRADGETIYIHHETEGCRNIEMNGYVVIERGCKIDGSVSLRNCIVLPETTLSISSKDILENCILGPDFKIDIKESEFLPCDENGILIGTGGSARRYYRIKGNGKTKVLMQCNESDADYERHIKYTRFFSKHSIPVPEIIDVKASIKQATFEDLGDISLYSWLKCKRAGEEIEQIYRQVLDILVLVHTRATKHVSECPALQNRLFDYEHYRWETSYFMERFVGEIRNIRPQNPSGINEEFHRLAFKAVSFPKTVIHRDFQSQNIMIHKGVPRLIDYQGARMGLPAYDIASILWDPYYRLEDEMRDRLLEYYINMMENHPPIPPLARGGLGGVSFTTKDFRETLLLCRLQRHMQALGAYGFLSSVIGKKHFVKHIPEGLRLLKEDASLSKSEYPELYKLVTEL